MVMTLALVAAVLPRALADTGDSVDVSSIEPSGGIAGGWDAGGEDAGELSRTGTDQPQGDTGTQPAAGTTGDGTGGGAGDGAGGDDLVIAAAAPPEGEHGGEEHARTPADVTQGQPGRADAQAGGQEDQGEQARQQGEQRDDLTLNACGGDGCTTQPPNPGNPIAAAINGGERQEESGGQQEPERQREPGEEAAPQEAQWDVQRSLEPAEVLDLIQRDLDTVVRHRQQLEAQGATQTPDELLADRALLGRAYNATLYLTPRVAGTPEAEQRLAELTQQVEELRATLTAEAEAQVARLEAAPTRRGSQPGVAPTTVGELHWDISMLEQELDRRALQGLWPSSAAEQQQEAERVEQIREGIQQLPQGTPEEAVATLTGRLAAVEQRLAGEPATPYQLTRLDGLEARIRFIEAGAQGAEAQGFPRPAQELRTTQNRLDVVRGDVVRIRAQMDSQEPRDQREFDQEDRTRFADLEARAAALQTSLEAEQAALVEDTPINQVDSGLSFLESRLAAGRRGASPNDQMPRWATAAQRTEEQARLEQVRQGIGELQAAGVAGDAARLAALTRRLQQVEQQLGAEPSTPYGHTPLDQIEGQLLRVERYEQDAARPQGQGRGWVQEREALLGDVADRIGQLPPETAEGPEGGRLADLRGRWAQQQRLLGYHGLYDAVARDYESRDQESRGQGNAMSMVAPEEVGPGQQSTHGRPVVLPPLPGFRPPLPPDTGTLVTPANPLKLPDKTVFTPPAVQLPNQTVFTPPALDPQLLTHQRTGTQGTETETRGTSETMDSVNQAGRTATKVLTLGAILGVAGYALYNTYLAALGALVPAEVLKNLPAAGPRPTDG
jgi:hypothetical protein